MSSFFSEEKWTKFPFLVNTNGCGRHMVPKRTHKALHRPLKIILRASNQQLPRYGVPILC